jgi:hypothetical protein
MYRAYGLLQPGSDFSIGEAASRLQTRFPTSSVAAGGDRITATEGDWGIEFWLNSDPSVLTESIGFAEKIAGAVDGLEIESCASRVEVWSDTADPFIEHLADFHAVLELLRGFRGLILIDPAEPALM